MNVVNCLREHAQEGVNEEIRVLRKRIAALERLVKERSEESDMHAMTLDVAKAHITELERRLKDLTVEAAKQANELRRKCEISQSLYEDKLELVCAERDSAKAAHEGQVKNTLAFQADLERAENRISQLEKERDELKARIAEFEAMLGIGEERVDTVLDALSRWHQLVKEKEREQVQITSEKV